MSIIICPNCKSELHHIEKMAKCQNGHSFDFSKEGYLNLLLANQKKNNNPGDNNIMINAREEFLSSGNYDFLLQVIEQNIQSLDLFSKPSDNNINLLDLGCGSGYYTRNLFEREKINKIGIDISKVGISKASLKNKESKYVVASVFDLPIENNSIDLIINIFSPSQLDEIRRVLKTGGYFIKVIPIGDHMKEVANLVYENFTPHQSTIKEEIDSTGTLQVIRVENLNKTISLSGQDLINFISMTPYLYKFRKSQLEELKELSVTISLQLIIAKNA